VGVGDHVQKVRIRNCRQCFPTQLLRGLVLAASGEGARRHAERRSQGGGVVLQPHLPRQRGPVLGFLIAAEFEHRAREVGGHRVGETQIPEGRHGFVAGELQLRSTRSIPRQQLGGTHEMTLEGGEIYARPELLEDGVFLVERPPSFVELTLLRQHRAVLAPKTDRSQTPRIAHFSAKPLHQVDRLWDRGGTPKCERCDPTSDLVAKPSESCRRGQQLLRQVQGALRLPTPEA